MKILSFDIGIKNLAYCLVDDKKLYDWNVINLLTADKCNCNIDDCKNNVFYIYNNLKFCKKHISKDLFLFKKDYLITNIRKKSNRDIVKLIKEINLEQGKKKEDNINILKSYYENNCYKSYKKQNCKTIDLIKIGKNLITFLDDLFKNDDYDIVLIENQIGPLANRMKTLQGMLTQYFLIKNKEVKYVSSQNKLKMLETKGKNYKQRKQLAIDYVPCILEKLVVKEGLNDIFKDSKKKDDLSDCLLQAWSYINN